MAIRQCRVAKLWKLETYTRAGTHSTVSNCDGVAIKRVGRVTYKFLKLNKRVGLFFRQFKKHFDIKFLIFLQLFTKYNFKPNPRHWGWG